MNTVPEQIIIRLVTESPFAHQWSYAGLCHIHQASNTWISNSIIDQPEYIQACDPNTKSSFDIRQGRFQRRIEPRL